MANKYADSADSPGNPDGCVLGKDQIDLVNASVELIANAFVDGAAKVTSALSDFSQAIQGVQSQFDFSSFSASISNLSSTVANLEAQTSFLRAEFINLSDSTSSLAISFNSINNEIPFLTTNLNGLSIAVGTIADVLDDIGRSTASSPSGPTDFGTIVDAINNCCSVTTQWLSSLLTALQTIDANFKTDIDDLVKSIDDLPAKINVPGGGGGSGPCNCSVELAEIRNAVIVLNQTLTDVGNTLASSLRRMVISLYTLGETVDRRRGVGQAPDQGRGPARDSGGIIENFVTNFVRRGMDGINALNTRMIRASGIFGTQLAETIGRFAGPVGRAAQVAAVGFGVAREGVSALAGGLMVGVSAIRGTVTAFGNLVGFAGRFVEAVNPALMEQMSYVMKDLMAVIGGALQPVIAAAVVIIRAFADKLQPVMQALAPIVQDLADQLIELAGPIIAILIESIGALEPIIQMIIGALKMWTAVLAWAAPYIAAIIKEIVYWLGYFQTAIQRLAAWIISWVDKKAAEDINKSADKTWKATKDYYDGVSKVQEAIKQPVKEGASVGAAARQATTTGVSELGKNIMQAAFSSSTQAATFSIAENTRRMADTLNRMDNRMAGAAPVGAPIAGVRRGVI